MLEVNDFNAIRISLASPEQIRAWSYGEVTKPETINYRTLKPEKDGLFCERIFGPTKDWECYCGKYKRIRFKGIICDKCGVEVARSKVRRERMGHIELAAPVSHIWYFKGTPSRLGLLLDISPRNLERILYFAIYIVTHIDEEARQKALNKIEQQLVDLHSNLDQQVIEYLENLQKKQVEELSFSSDLLEQDRKSLADSLSRDLELAQQSEAHTREALISSINEITEKPILFEPMEYIVVQAGEVVASNHIAQLDKMAEEYRQTIIKQAKKEQEQLTAHSDKKNEKLHVAYDAELAMASTNVETHRKEEHLRLEQLQRDLQDMKVKDLLQETQYREYKDAFGEVFHAGMGAEAVKELICKVDLTAFAAELRQEIASTIGQRRKKAIKQLKAVQDFRKSGVAPEWMIMNVLPVLPPDLRPMVQLDGGRFATSDLNDLYRRVINRNNRLKKLIELGAPEIIIRNEKRMLQESCDALIDNGRRGRAVAGSGNHKLKSLSDMLKGKTGRFRQNLLGKRVDYSGRSVIVVGPDLKLHQCGLPKKMALELFKPFVMRKLVELNLAHNIKSAKRLVERIDSQVWSVLEQVTQDHPVLLNRAPTLHRLGIQAFDVKLVEGSAIQLHPLVCTAFNADFDGDQMAVHVPLSEKAQDEARERMLSTRNTLSIADGSPIIAATNEIVLGCYYLTKVKENAKGEGKLFASPEEAVLAHSQGFIDLQARIYLRFTGNIYPTENRNSVQNIVSGRIETTVGRVILNNALPERLKFINYELNKARIKTILAECYKLLGRTYMVELADEIKRLGFTYATKAATSLATVDIVIPPQRALVLAEAEEALDVIHERYMSGLITDQEVNKQTEDIWSTAQTKVENAVMDALDKNGTIQTLMTSKAGKQTPQQIRQLSGMRGLMDTLAKSRVQFSIKGNFKEGLSPLEFFISCHGSRKGLSDTALRTAESGYLTRRMVDVAQDVIVAEYNCGTTDNILIVNRNINNMADSGLPSFSEVLEGRVLAEAISGHENIAVGEIFTDEAIKQLENTVSDVRVRSALTCQTKHGICQLCYGKDLSTGNLVNIGTAVGIIAAQSIGEPGTQLTMRTFYSGGTASAQGDITQGLPRVEELLEARILHDVAEISEISGIVNISIDEETGYKVVTVTSSNVYFDDYIIPDEYIIQVKNNEEVTRGQVFAVHPKNSDKNIVARESGTIEINGKHKLRIRFIEQEERVYPIIAAHQQSLLVMDGDKVEAGQRLVSAGSMDVQKLLLATGVKEAEKYLVDEVQRVYRTQGAYINSKHVEVIVRQMFRRVRIEQPGDSEWLHEEIVDRFEFADTNAHILAQGGMPAVARIIILGITKASLRTDSFLSAASFQETTRVLTDAAIQGKIDRLAGLKENVIIGKLIPAGTGIIDRITNFTALPPVEPTEGIEGIMVAGIAHSAQNIDEESNQ